MNPNHYYGSSFRFAGAVFVLALCSSRLPYRAAAVTPSGDELSDRRDWVAARFEGRAPAPPTDPAVMVLNNHGPVLKNARAGRPLRLGTQNFTNGLLAHAPSQLLIRLPGPGETFTALAGIDSNEQTSGGRGSVEFGVTVHGTEVFRSSVLREGTAGVPVNVGLGGATEFVIQGHETADGIASDHADWVQAQVRLKNGRELWLSDLPLRDALTEQTSTAPPFAFVYGGQPSADFLAQWSTERRSRSLDSQRTEWTRQWVDPASGLQVRCVAVEYADFPTVEWTVYLKNGGTEETPVIAELQALDVAFGRGSEGEFVLHHHIADNCTADSYTPHAVTLGPGSEQRFASAGGRPTTGGFPYFNLERPSGGVVLAVGWPGQWAAQFSRDADRGLRVRAGQELTRFRLRPGEEVRTPLVVLQFWKDGDWIRAQNVWRRWMVAHNLPRPGGKLVPTHYGGCFGSMRPRASEELEQFDGWQREGIRLDYWFIDAGWYTHPDGWWNVGTWEIDRERFPRGLREVADRVHQADAGFVVWFEPERAVDGSWLEQNHPEWILRSGGARLVNLGQRDAWHWVLDRIDSLLTSEAIDVYRQDFNMDPLDCWRAADAPDRQGITEIRHVEGYLALWDTLLQRHPGLLIDTCASGGRRNDLETLRRAVPLLRSDYPLTSFNAACSEGQQCHTLGISLWMPYHGTGMPLSDAYSMRSGFVPAFRLGWDVRDRQVDLALLRRTVAEFRQCEPYLLGDFYPLTVSSLAKDVWVAWQYDRPEEGRGLIQAFRRESSPYEVARFKLRGLEDGSTYRVTDLDQPDAPQQHTGRELRERGLAVALPAPRSSGLMIYQRSNAPDLPAGAPPAAEIASGPIRARLYLPEAQTGFYRGTRFDWSGVIGSLEYAGHEYYPPWFQRSDPNVHDFVYAGADIVAGPCTAITGPAEEFVAEGGALGFSQAEPGGKFLKIGVGVLRRPDTAPYDPFRLYPIVDGGRWTVGRQPDAIEFRQSLDDASSGYAYEYRKTVAVAGNHRRMTLDHSLRNTGSRVIRTSVYNHNFLYLDRQAPGPGVSLTFPFKLRTADSTSSGLVEVRENRIAFLKTLTGTDRVYLTLSGFGAGAKDYDIRTEYRDVGAGVRITADRPLSRLALWAIRAPLSIEPFIDMEIAPGAEFTWRIDYEYYTIPKSGD